MKLSGDGVGFEVLVHIATLLAVVICLRKDVASLIRGFFRGARRIFASAPEGAGDDEQLALAIVVGTIPAVLASLLFSSRVEESFGRPEWTGGFLLATGVVLLLTRFAGSGERPLGLKIALLIGLAQAVALLPGISRSGITIATAIFLGVPRGEAVRFSFLLAIPAIGGAFLYTAASDSSSILEASSGPSALAFFAALAAGCVAIVVLLRTVRRGRFELFGLYCLAAGGAALALF